MLTVVVTTEANNSCPRLYIYLVLLYNFTETRVALRYPSVEFWYSHFNSKSRHSLKEIIVRRNGEEIVRYVSNCVPPKIWLGNRGSPGFVSSGRLRGSCPWSVTENIPPIRGNLVVPLFRSEPRGKSVQNELVFLKGKMPIVVVFCFCSTPRPLICLAS